MKDSELKSILSEVESELKDLLKAESDKLAKAAPGEDTPAEEASLSAEGDAPPDAPPADASPAPEASASAPGEESLGGDPGMDAGPADDLGGDPAGEAMDPEALKAAYMDLPDDQLQLHLAAIKEAVMARMGGQGVDAPVAPPGPEASAPPAGPPPGAGAPAPAFKGEKDYVDGANGGEKLAVKKSENSEVAALKAELELQKAQAEKTDAALGSLVKAFTNVLGQPVRKAVTDLTFVPKTDGPAIDVKNMSRSQVTEKLAQVTKDPSLKKSDRELIDSYYVNGVSLDKIAHLLK